MEMILQLVEKRVRTFRIHCFSGSCRCCQDQILIFYLFNFILFYIWGSALDKILLRHIYLIEVPSHLHYLFPLHIVLQKFKEKNKNNQKICQEIYSQ